MGLPRGKPHRHPVGKRYELVCCSRGMGTRRNLTRPSLQSLTNSGRNRTRPKLSPRQSHSTFQSAAPARRRKLSTFESPFQSGTTRIAVSVRPPVPRGDKGGQSRDVMDVANSEASTSCQPTAPDHQCRPCIDEDQARCLREQRSSALCVCVSAHWTPHHMLTGSILLRRQWLEARGPLQPCGWTSADQREHRCRRLHHIQAVPRSARRLHELRNFRGALPPSRAPTPIHKQLPS